MDLEIYFSGVPKYSIHDGYVIIVLKKVMKTKLATTRHWKSHLTEDFQTLVVEAEITSLQKYLSIMLEITADSYDELTKKCYL